MRRYRGADKPPGPSISPPPRERFSSAGGKPPVRASASATMESINNNNPLMMSGSATGNLFQDNRFGPMPEPGRSIPKLRMADLASSLSPLMEAEIYGPRVPRTLTDKRIAATMREVAGGSSKDMLESFDAALRAPDINSINSRMAMMRRGQIPKNHSSTTASVGGPVKIKTGSVSTGVSKQASGRLVGKNEEQNMRLLMDQLKDKYLDDMESQLGLAVERRPSTKGRGGISRSESYSGGDGPMEFGVPKPSTNASEITSRIDKVVRNWAADSQRLSGSANISKQASLQQASQKGAQKDAGTSALNSPVAEKKIKASASVGTAAAPPEKNKNLQVISDIFRKRLDPVSKRDVKELIYIPDDDHIEKLQDEHDQRRRAHESIFNNAVVMDPPSSPSRKKKNSPPKKNTPLKNEPAASKVQKPAPPTAAAKGAQPTAAKAPQPKANPVPPSPKVEEKKKEPARKPFQDAIKLAKPDENEFYSIIKEHSEYEMGAGPPKISDSRKASYGKVRQESSRQSLLRSDTAGKALLKYNESHKKLQSLVDAFHEKVDAPTPTKRPGPSARGKVTRRDDSLSGTSDIDEDKPVSALPAMDTIIGSQTTLPSRKKTTLDVTATLSRSMRTIDRASGVAQRLGTLINRVSLRNEKYDYEEQQEEEARLAAAAATNSTSTGTSPMDSNANFIQADSDSAMPVGSPQKTPMSSAMALGGPSGGSINPYEMPNTSSSANRLAGMRLPGTPNVPLGITKLDSNQFGKYVTEMKKVAEKAAESFEKFKEKQLKVGEDNELLSSSEGEGEEVDLAPFQQQPKQQRKQQQQQQHRSINFQAGASGSARTTTTKVNHVNTSLTPREEVLEHIGIQTKATADPKDFKFVPDMSYTDQLMLQKLRKLKQKEGWGDSMQDQIAQLAQAADVDLDDDGNPPPFNPMEMDALLKRATAIEIPKRLEQPGMGAAVSLNAIIKARMNDKGKGKPVGKK